VAVESLSALTLATHDVAASVAFYESLGFRKVWDGRGGAFVVLNAGRAWLNLFAAAPAQEWGRWGRFILYVVDVDATFATLQAAGYSPEMEPSDAPWGERYFHVLDPAGHEVSIARRLAG
jgi:catechol 2,3-dioxygenase-like lactoylglutathione lyase family enzyme